MNAQLLTPVEALDVNTCFTCGQSAVAVDTRNDKLLCAVHAHGPFPDRVRFLPGKRWGSSS